MARNRCAVNVGAVARHEIRPRWTASSHSTSVVGPLLLGVLLLLAAGVPEPVVAATFSGSQTISGGAHTDLFFDGGLTDPGTTIRIDGGAQVSGVVEFKTAVANARIDVVAGCAVAGEINFESSVTDTTVNVADSTIAFMTFRGATRNLTLVWRNVQVQYTGAAASSHLLSFGNELRESNVLWADVRGQYLMSGAGGRVFEAVQGMRDSNVTVRRTNLLVDAINGDQRVFVLDSVLPTTRFLAEDCHFEVKTVAAPVAAARCVDTQSLQGSNVTFSNVTCTYGEFVVDGSISSGTVLALNRMRLEGARLHLKSSVADSKVTIADCYVSRTGGMDYQGPLLQFRSSVASSDVVITGTTWINEPTVIGGDCMEFGSSFTGGRLIFSRNSVLHRPGSGTTDALDLINFIGVEEITFDDNDVRLISTNGEGVGFSCLVRCDSPAFRIRRTNITVSAQTATGIKLDRVTGALTITDSLVSAVASSNHGEAARLGSSSDDYTNTTVVIGRSTFVAAGRSTSIGIHLDANLSPARRFVLHDSAINVSAAVSGDPVGLQIGTDPGSITFAVTRNRWDLQLDSGLLGAEASHIRPTVTFTGTDVILADNYMNRNIAAGQIPAVSPGSSGMADTNSITLRCNTYGLVILADLGRAGVNSAVTSTVPCTECTTAIDCNEERVSSVVSAVRAGVEEHCRCACLEHFGYGVVSTNQTWEEQCVASPFGAVTTTTTTAAPTTITTMPTTTTTVAPVTTTTTAAPPTTSSTSAPTTGQPPATTTATTTPGVPATTEAPATTATGAPITTTAPPPTTTMPPATPGPPPAPTNASEPELVPEPVRQGGQGAVIVAGGGSGLGRGSPSWAAHASRNAALSFFAQCPQELDGDEELDTVVNPTGLAIGSEPTRQYLGALVADAAIIVGMAVGQALIGIIVYCVGGGGEEDDSNDTGDASSVTEQQQQVPPAASPVVAAGLLQSGGAAPERGLSPCQAGTANRTRGRARRTLAGALLAAKLPRANYVWFLLFLQPITQCSLVLASQSAGLPIYYLLGTFAFTIAQGGSLFLLLAITGERLKAVYVPRPWAVAAGKTHESDGDGTLPATVDPDERTDDDAHTAPSNFIVSAFTPRGDWFPGDSSDTAARLHHSTFKPLYGPFHRRGRLFIMADLLLALIFSAAASVFPTTRNECITQMSTIVGSMFLYLVAVVASRPFNVPIDNVLLAALATLELGAAVALLVAVATTNPDTAVAGREWSERIETGATFVTFGILAKDCCVAVGRLWLKKQDAARLEEARQLQAAQDADSALNVDDVPDDDGEDDDGEDDDGEDDDGEDDDGEDDDGARSGEKNPIKAAFDDGVDNGGGGAFPAAAAEEDAGATERVNLALEAAEDCWDVAADGQHWVVFVPVPHHHTTVSGDGFAELWCDPDTGYVWDAETGWWYDPASQQWWVAPYDEQEALPAADETGAASEGAAVPEHDDAVATEGTRSTAQVSVE